jgi:hypothetical protein
LRDRRFLLSIGGLFELIGIALLGGAALSYRSSSAFEAAAQRTEGTVVDLEPRRSSSGGDVYRPIVEFACRDGRTVRIAGGTASNPPAFRRGDRVGVLYRPGAPEEARLDRWADRWLGVILLGVLGFAFSAAALAPLLIGLRLRPRRAGPDPVRQP